MADLTISQKLDSIINTKANIKQAIINKGQQVNDVFDTYAAAIENIQTSPSVENLDTQLNTQDNLLNTQNITISNIANALNGKSLPGGGSIDGNNVYNLDAFNNSSYAESILNYVQVYPTELDMSNKQGSLSYLFKGCQYMTNVPNLINYDASNNYVDIVETFSECKNLTEINININNALGIGQMRYAFYNCQNLKTINFIQPNAFTNENSDITQDLMSVFSDCRNLTEININNGFVTASSISSAFSNCYNITDLSNIIIGVSRMTADPTYTFHYCYNLVNFPVFEGQTDYPIGSISGMFDCCNYLNNNILNTILDHFNFDYLAHIDFAFEGCTNLTALPSQFNYDNINNFASAFSGVNITDINLSISNGSSLQRTFSSTYPKYNETTQGTDIIETNSPLTNLTLTNCSNVQYIDEMCINCKNLRSVNISNLSTNLYQCSYMFANCQNLTNVAFENCEFGSVYQTSSMFENCYNLVDCPNISTLSNSLQQTDCMFADCYNLVNVPTLNMEQVYSATDMFKNCYNLSNQSLENILNMRLTQIGYIYSYLGITENQFNIMKNLPSFTNAVNNGWPEQYK